MKGMKWQARHARQEASPVTGWLTDLVTVMKGGPVSPVRPVTESVTAASGDGLGPLARRTWWADLTDSVTPPRPRDGHRDVAGDRRG